MLSFNAASSTSPTLFAKPSSQFHFSDSIKSITTLAILAGVVTKALIQKLSTAVWLDIYSVLMVRVLVNWFPNIPWDRQPLSAIRDLCDPYLNLFRNIIPFVFVVYLSLWEDAASMFSGVLTPAERTQSVMVDTTVNPKIFGGERSKNSKVFRPVMEEEIRKKKVESWCKAVERTFDRILECVIVEAWLKRSRKKWGLRPMKGFSFSNINIIQVFFISLEMLWGFKRAGMVAYFVVLVVVVAGVG
ncbi:hypothetical protein HID58_062106 [Brassica napus]|uniref:Uncharacterized protein n=1 Tax=Brassica napus TaxID=3708 RepID=A0ABQ8A0H8_BRANA|nr:hypothetical protein HID58_062106 [Brassica napus]